MALPAGFLYPPLVLLVPLPLYLPLVGLTSPNSLSTRFSSRFSSELSSELSTDLPADLTSSFADLNTGCDMSLITTKTKDVYIFDFKVLIKI